MYYLRIYIKQSNSLEALSHKALYLDSLWPLPLLPTLPLREQQTSDPEPGSPLCIRRGVELLFTGRGALLPKAGRIFRDAFHGTTCPFSRGKNQVGPGKGEESGMGGQVLTNRSLSANSPLRARLPASLRPGLAHSHWLFYKHL